MREARYRARARYVARKRVRDVLPPRQRCFISYASRRQMPRRHATLPLLRAAVYARRVVTVARRLRRRAALSSLFSPARLLITRAIVCHMTLIGECIRMVE